ncbi:MAG: sialidase family protein [Planctomycetota bacterium]
MRHDHAPFGLLVLCAATGPLLNGCPPDHTATDVNFNVGGTPTPLVTAGEPVLLSEFIFNGIPGRAGNHAPTVAALPDGELLAAWYSYVGPGELDGADVCLSRKPAGAVHWTTPTLLIDRPEAVGNPVLYAEGEQLWLFHAVVPGTGWSSAHVEVQRSDDGGQTWSSPRTLPGPLGTNVRFPPARLSNGTLLLPAYSDLLPRSLFFATTDDDYWTLRSELATRPPHANLQPSLAVLNDGRLLAVMRNGGGGWLWASLSTNGGRSWATPADSGFPNPNSPAALLRLASGNLILIFNDSATLRRPLSAAVSADGGVTWHPPRVLVDGDDGEHAYPSAVQAPDGWIHVVYSHDRQRIGHVTFNGAWLAD